MAEPHGLDFTTNFSNISLEGETSLNRPVRQVSFIVLIIINSITCPFTVLLNTLVIMAVKRRPRLQTKTNILLACLAVTDASTGLISQPLFILWNTLELLGVAHVRDTLGLFHSSLLRGLGICSALHLMLLTGERLVAIRFTMHHPYIVITRNIKMAVIAFWIFSIFYFAFGLMLTVTNEAVYRLILNVSAGFIVISCVLFVASAYVILYRETLRHRKMIKTKQMPQEEVQRFAKESKALKTTVLVVGAVILFLLPVAFTALLSMILINPNTYKAVIVNACVPCLWVRTFVMLNSFVNPLIYCWRQKEMRQFVFRLSPPAVAPGTN